jgi:hypothetical protein
MAVAEWVAVAKKKKKKKRHLVEFLWMENREIAKTEHRVELRGRG